MKYEFLSIYIIALTGLFATYQKTPTNANEPGIARTDTFAIAAQLLTLTDAEKIMGEKARLTSNTFLKKGDTLEYKCEYTALSKDSITKKTGTLYFMHEIYQSAAAAANAYAGIYKGNSQHEGVEVVKGLGDEAYYHTDQTGFYFFLVRKNEKMFRLKLNKVTSHSSAIEFKMTARRIVGKL